MQEITRDFIRTLAAVNGIAIAEERLERVRQQYESFLQTVREIESVPARPETEPVTTFALAAPAIPSQDGGR